MLRRNQSNCPSSHPSQRPQHRLTRSHVPSQVAAVDSCRPSSSLFTSENGLIYLDLTPPEQPPPGSVLSCAGSPVPHPLWIGGRHVSPLPTPRFHRLLLCLLIPLALMTVSAALSQTSQFPGGFIERDDAAPRSRWTNSQIQPLFLPDAQSSRIPPPTIRRPFASRFRSTVKTATACSTWGTRIGGTSIIMRTATRC